jgi:hypothetical protein
MVDDSMINWETLYRWLRRQGLDPDLLKALEARLRDLKKPSLLKKAHHHLERLAVDTAGLWLNYRTAEDQFRHGLAEAYRARNKLVHSTSIKNLSRFGSDLARLQCLCERLVARLIDAPCPDINRGMADALWEAQYSASGL